MCIMFNNMSFCNKNVGTAEPSSNSPAVHRTLGTWFQMLCVAVNMEGDEIEMSTVELQAWIEEKIKTNKLMSSDVLVRCELLQSLLLKRGKQANHLLKLCQSVTTCEALVKKQYSLLGWEYRDTDPDDNNINGCGNTVPSSPTTNGHTSLLPKQHYSENLSGVKGKNNSISRKREPVVVLTRLSANKIRSYCPWMSENHNNHKGSSIDSNSDMQMEPEEDSSVSGLSISNYTTLPNNKRRKIDQNSKTLAQSPATALASTNPGAKSNVTSTSTPQVGTNSNANGNAKSNLMKTPTAPATTKVTRVCPVSITSFSQTSDKATKTPPRVPHVEFKTDMSVLARKKAMSWVQGRILERVTKEDGKVKYKIKFEEKGKSLVSGHHIAFDCLPTVDQLFVGARVVVKFSVDECRFCPGVLGELPSRRNRMRFLVFIDDHRSVYVGLPLLRMVCRPLNDPLDDIQDGFHKNFMKGYMKAWPYPPLSQFKVGQIINVELKGVVQSCVVRTIDCSLIHVVVSSNEHRQWIYRGSTCLPQINNVKEPLELNRDNGPQNKSPS